MSLRKAPTESELYRSLELVRRHLTILVVLPILAAVVAFGVTKFVVTPTWRATAEVLVSPTSTENLLLNLPTSPDADRTRTVATEVALIQSRPIALAVANQLPQFHGDVAAVPPVSAAPVGQTDVIALHVSGTNRAEVTAVATAYATAYIGERKDEILREVTAAEAGLQSQMDALQKQIAVYDAQLGAAIPENRQFVQDSVGPLRNAIITQQSTLRDRLVSLQVESGLASGGARLVQAAPRPGVPASPRKVLDIAIAVAAALLVAIGVAVIRETLDDRIHAVSDLAAPAGGVVAVGAPLPALGWRGTRRARKGGRPSDVPAASLAEDYRALQLSVDALRTRDGVRRLLVAGPRGGEGSTTIAASLAVTLARSGTSVLLADTNLRRPALHEAFGLTNSGGLRAVLAGDRTGATSVAAPGVPGLSLLTAGAEMADPAGLLRSPESRTALESLDHAADLVIFDAGPLLAFPDAAAVAAAADVTVLVARLGSTTHADVAAALELLDSTQSRPAIVALYDGRRAPKRPGDPEAMIGQADPEPVPPTATVASAGPPDAGPPDAGLPDPGPADTGPPDTGPPAAAPSVARVPDAPGTSPH